MPARAVRDPRRHPVPGARPAGEISVPVLDFRAEADPDGAGAGVDARRPGPADGPRARAAVPPGAAAGRRRPGVVVPAVPPHRHRRRRHRAAVPRGRPTLYSADETPIADWALSRLADAEQELPGERAVRGGPRVLADPVRRRARRRPGCWTAPPRPMRRLERRRVVLGRRSGRRLREFARRSGSRPSRVLIAAVAGYVHRVTGAPEVVLGLPVTGRVGAAARHGARHGVERAAAAAADRPGRAAGRPGRAGSAPRCRDVVAHSRFRAEELARELGVADGVAGLVGPTVNVRRLRRRPRLRRRARRPCTACGPAR